MTSVLQLFSGAWGAHGVMEEAKLEQACQCLPGRAGVPGRRMAGFGFHSSSYTDLEEPAPRNESPQKRGHVGS